MLVLLDESMPFLLTRDLPGHEATTVRRMGWSGLRNGELLRRAVSAGFEALLTVDRSIPYQQNVSRLGIAVIVLRARSNRLEDLLPLVPAVLDTLQNVKPGQVVEIGAETV